MGTKMVVEIACGANFSMCLCDDGSVYTWGKNDKGQLGLGDTDVHEQPVKVIGLAGKGIKKLCGGECHALALTKDGQVFSWGAGNMGQLGLGEAANKTEPQLVPGLNGMGSIVAAGNVSWAWRNIEAPPATAKKRKAESAAAADAKKPKK